MLPTARSTDRVIRCWRLDKAIIAEEFAGYAEGLGNYPALS